MKIRLTAIVTILALMPRAVFGAACCLGGSTKSFISLQRLQTYEIGLSTSVRDVYGNFNLFGELDEAERNQTFAMALGVGARLTQDLQAFGILPWIYQTDGEGLVATSRSGVGDAMFGAQYMLVESLFRDDWYPTIMLTGGMKVPTGSIETRSVGRLLPGTGNGVWEPFVGVSFDKPIGLPVVSLKAVYTARPGERGALLGDMIELTGQLSAALTQRFSLAGGVTGAWIMKDGQRLMTAFLAPTYFLTRFWSVAAGAEVAVPMDGFGVGQQAARLFTVTTKYGFF